MINNVYIFQTNIPIQEYSGKSFDKVIHIHIYHWSEENFAQIITIKYACVYV